MSAPADVARVMRWGARFGVIDFHDGTWWWIDYTGRRHEPISRKDAYLTAISYMDAQEVADYNVPASALAELPA